MDTFSAKDGHMIYCNARLNLPPRALHFCQDVIGVNNIFSTAINLTHPQALKTVQDADCYV
jgi:hypothetical protein